MTKVTMWFDVDTAFGKTVIGRAFDLFDLKAGSITEIINGQYCVDFEVKNTVEEITNIEVYLKQQFPEINLCLEIEIG